MKKKALITVLGIATMTAIAALTVVALKKRRQKSQPQEEYTGQAKQDLGT